MSNLWFGEIEEYTCEIHPVVPHTILQHFLRKQGPASSCMGLLLGTVTEGLVQVCQTLPINYLSADENKVSLRPFGEQLKQQYLLLRETYPKYTLIGIYTMGDLNKKFIAIIQYLEKEYSVNKLLLYKLKPHSEGIDSQCYLLLRLKLETVAMFKPIPTRIIQAPFAPIVKKEQFLSQTVREIREYLKKSENEVKDKEVALWLGKAVVESKGLA